MPALNADDPMEMLDVCAGAAASYMAKCLLGERENEIIEQIARLLPAAAFPTFGFECHLNGIPHADFLAGVPGMGTSREILAGRDPARALPAELMEHPVWTRVRDFSRIWATPTSPLFRGVRDIWLEFDVDHCSGKVPLPSVFLGLAAPQQPRGGHRGGNPPRWLTDTALPVLLGSPIRRETVDKLRDCLAGLPGGARVPFVALMLARGSDTLRLCLIGVPSDQVPGYLRRIGWLGPFRELDVILSMASQIARLDMLQIEVGQTVSPRIGLELTVPWLPDPLFSVPHWKRFLDHLVEIDLCSAEQRDGLLAWPGLAPFAIGDIPWTADSGQGPVRRHPMAWGLLVKHIRHIKISLQTDKALEAKAYLLCHRCTTTSS